MITNRSALTLFFTVMFLCTSYSRPMEKKIILPPPIKKANPTVKNMVSFVILFEEEKKLHKECCDISLLLCTLGISENLRKDFEKNKQDLKLLDVKIIQLLQAIFRDIVRRDILKKEPYTLSLGLKIGANNTLTMERLPINEYTKYLHNKLLITLSLDPDNKEARKTLEELQLDRINPSQSADIFFPQILFRNGLDKSTIAEYDASTNMIYTSSTNISLCDCHQIVHEFIHRLQYAASYECGGVFIEPIAREAYKFYPNGIAVEIEACRLSIENHPNLTYLLASLVKAVKPFNKRDTTLNFPYYSQTCEYAIAYEKWKEQAKGLNKNTVQIFENAYSYASEHYKKRKDAEKNIITSNNYLLTGAYPLIQRERINSYDFAQRLQKITNNKNVLQNLVEIVKIDIPNNPLEKIMLNRDKIFELKKKLNLLSD